jgi:hypothetical protein
MAILDGNSLMNCFTFGLAAQCRIVVFPCSEKTARPFFEYENLASNLAVVTRCNVNSPAFHRIAAVGLIIA